MHTRRLACFLLGAWIAGSLFMTMVATQNFRSVDRLLAAPSPVAAKQIESLGPEPARAFLRYQVSEQNRWYFEIWELIQLALGAALLFTLLLGSMANRPLLLLGGLMLAIVLVMRFYLTPEIVQLGRAIDFVPRDEPSAERARFWNFHNSYSALEVMKWGLAALLSLKLLLRSRTEKVARKVDAVDYADDRHINR